MRPPLTHYRTISTPWPDLDLEIMEFEPQRRIIKIYQQYNAKFNTFYLPFPYMQFVRAGGLLFVTFSNKPIKSWDDEDETYFPLLPNVYSSGLICMGGSDNSIVNFWNTSYYYNNNWKGPSLTRFIVPDAKSFSPHLVAIYDANYEKWAAIEDPLSIQWPEKLPLKDVVYTSMYKAKGYIGGIDLNQRASISLLLSPEGEYTDYVPYSSPYHVAKKRMING